MQIESGGDFVAPEIRELIIWHMLKESGKGKGKGRRLGFGLRRLRFDWFSIQHIDFRSKGVPCSRRIAPHARTGRSSRVYHQVRVRLSRLRCRGDPGRSLAILS